jgi:hypothetical protein
MNRLLIIFLLLLSSHLHAATVPATVFYNATGSQYSPANASTQFSSASAACQSVYTNSTHPSKKAATLVGNICQLSYTTTTTISEYPIYTVYACPSPLTQVGSGTPTASTLCTVPACPTGQVWSTVTNSCTQDCAPLTGQRSDFSVNCSNGNMPSSVCMTNNCAATVVDSFLAQNKTSNCWFGVGTGKYTGHTCTGQTSISALSNPTNANPPPVDKPETDCVKQGKTFGTVNGVVVCVPLGSASGAPTKTGTQSTTTTTEKDANGNPVTTGKTETSSELSQDGDAVVTKETKKNEDGSTTTTETESTKDNFCEKNPNHAICKPQPDDACEENPDLPQCMKVGEADDSSVIVTQTRTVSFAPVSITSGGSCPADKSVSIAGKSITFSYTWLCNYASMFKPFMLAFAYLSAAMFLFMGLKGSNS